MKDHPHGFIEANSREAGPGILRVIRYQRLEAANGLVIRGQKVVYRAGTAAMPFSTRRAISCLTLRIFSA